MSVFVENIIVAFVILSLKSYELRKNKLMLHKFTTQVSTFYSYNIISGVNLPP